ncbi:MAG: hypothetical protein LBE79_01845 [Tannerella sp.]|jgi:hypothetical protein|nr:hypothetical protein [Tannerella sp.]
MNKFYDKFLDELALRYPRKTELVDALLDILILEKESVYRRLRKDVYFTSEEMMQIAGAWNISLDNIICTTPHKTKPFHFSMLDYIKPQEADYKVFEDFNRAMELVVKDPAGKMIEVTNTLPGTIYLEYDNLTRFFTMKWFYKYAIPEDTLVFADTHIPDRMREMEREYIESVRNIHEVYTICDSSFIEHLISNVQYFKSVRMITQKEITLLKDELLDIIDYMEDAALKGYFPETGNKLYFYLSHTWLETEFLLYESKFMTLSMVKTLELGGICSWDKNVFDKFMNMVQSTKRSSVLLSASNDLQIIRFFSKQKELIMELDNEK